ncbi:putative baseplate assembly protein [Nitrosospira briensis]|uniref:putative baseplate assembly protein n=1 Tax=Nitrosospira briensis TaxID=35799 RepID=UPI0008EC6585|nr:putative baseplate assembly protein [Nitrosospira briensis]SFN69717.1 putative baseplate assembly protein [Nitrosospira briensis]
MKQPCDCCEGPDVLTPLPADNRPGLSKLRYRAGTHGTFFETMRARLSSLDFPELATLKTRERSDPAMALLDAWATVADVLTFYQERIANEGYLRTATERRSILEQARLVGYRSRPGVAASVYLAYTIEKDMLPVEIPRGAKVNSIPAPGEQMQAFETSEPLMARNEWNALKPRMTQPQTPRSILQPRSIQQPGGSVYLKGIATNLKPNDVLLMDFGIDGADPLPFRVYEIKPDSKADRTQVFFRSWNGGDPARQIIEELAKTCDSRGHDLPEAYNALKIRNRIGQELTDRLNARATTQELTEYLRYLYPKLSLWEQGVKNVREKMKNGETEEQIISWVNHVTALLASALNVLGGDASKSPIQQVGAAPVVKPESGQEKTKLFLGQLKAPPSIPPANAKQLARPVKSTFSAQAEIFPKLISTLSPRLNSTLYPALGNAEVTEKPGIKVYALRKAASLFGHNAPKEPRYEPYYTEEEQKKVPGTFNPHAGNLRPQNEWCEWALANDEKANIAYLDTVYEQVLSGSYAVIQRQKQNYEAEGEYAPIVKNITHAVAISRGEYGLTTKTTRLTFAEKWWDAKRTTPLEQSSQDAPLCPEKDDFELVRTTTVYCHSEELALAEEPAQYEICGDEIELDGIYEGLEPGRWMIVSGERTDLAGTSGITASELVMLAEVVQKTQTTTQIVGMDHGDNKNKEKPLPGDKLHTFIKFDKKLAYCYKRETVTIYANVVKATHGETRREVLGSGDASKAFQSFELKQFPLTYVSAPTVSGIASTLETRVNDIKWHEAGNLSELGERDRKFITFQNDDEKTTITFGNGERGARLPTGQENIRAVYRSGIGKPGNVRASQISLLATRPLGVKAVINPIRASGGADKESRDQARKNVPLALLALDRLVSTSDYADFTRTFAGIGKAAAIRSTRGRLHFVQVTIAGAEDIPIDESSDLYRNLNAALHRHGDPHMPIQLKVRERLALVISANVRIHPDHLWEVLEPKIRTAMLEAFGFEKLELGEDLLLAEAVRVIQNVRGVIYVDVDVFDKISETELLAGFTVSAPAGQREEAAKPVMPKLLHRIPIEANQLAYLAPEVPDTLILQEIKT